MSERYDHEERPGDYRHDRHAGNVGDVWKHLVLHALLGELASKPDPVTVIETHAGSGRYALGLTGEWTEGIGRLRTPMGFSLLDHYASSQPVGAGGPRVYEGSPVLIRTYLREHDRAISFELDAEVFSKLTSVIRDERFSLSNGDGRRALAELEPPHRTGLLLIDPPWTAKKDWIEIPDELVAWSKRFPAFVSALWYPIKSYTRVHTMISRIRASGISCTVLELLTTPLTDRKNRLNGSGMLIVNCPAAALAAVSESAPTLGRLCATRGYWNFKAEEG